MVQVGYMYITWCRSLRDLHSPRCINHVETSTSWYNLYLQLVTEATVCFVIYDIGYAWWHTSDAACEWGQVEAAVYLVEMKADVNYENKVNVLGWIKGWPAITMNVILMNNCHNSSSSLVMPIVISTLTHPLIPAWKSALYLSEPWCHMDVVVIDHSNSYSYLMNPPLYWLTGRHGCVGG